MKKAIIFFLGVVTGRYLINLADRAFSILVHGYHSPDYTPYTKLRFPTYTSYYRSKYSPEAYDTKDDVVFDTYTKAIDVLEKCEDEIDRYGQCTVGRFKELAMAVTEKYIKLEYTDQQYGWKSLSEAGIVRASDGYGYAIKLPKEEWLED